MNDRLVYHMEYIDLILLGLVAFVLWYWFKRREDEERHLGWKLVGYYLLGIFTFKFNGFPIPLGLVIFLLLLKPTINQKVKSYAVYTGLAVVILSITIPYAQEKFYEFPREVEAKGPNSIYDFQFQDNWKKLKEEFNINFAIIEMIDLKYTKDGHIEYFRFQAEDHSNGIDQVRYFIELEGSEEWHVQRSRSEYEQPPHWQEEQEKLTVNQFFRMLDEVDLREMQPGESSKRFHVTAHYLTKSYYAVKENEKYGVTGSEVFEITNDQLPVYGYTVDMCGYSGKVEDCTTYANYLFEPVLNAKDDAHE